jgi:exopolysaccharide production protein ExoQ
MPPIVALFLTLGFIVFLFRRDFREQPAITGALWLPLIWTFLIASRPVSKWLNDFGVTGFLPTSAEEGSSLDALVVFGLIASALYILHKRRVRVSEVIRDNAWLTLFVLYCLLAIFWSDFPFVSFKRWIKILGHPVMVLILFTEPDPAEALVRLLKRCAYIILPVSILFLKYYPALGRTYSPWGGTTNCGIAGGKNQLGGVCSILGFFFVWHLFQVLRMKKNAARRNELYLTAGLLLMSGYCLWKAHSATSNACFLLAVATMALLGLGFVNKRTIGAYAIAGIIILVIAQLTFDIYGRVVDLSGHESTIEGRGRLWETLLETDTNPIFGAGFESYWLGERVGKLWSMKEFWWRPNQAHNGYLELYLNLGILGLLIFAGVIFATFWKIRLDLIEDFEWGRFRMGCLVAILVHNWTEAGFKGLSFPFLVLFIIAVNYPQPKSSPIAPSDDAVSTDEEMELVYTEHQVR